MGERGKELSFGAEARPDSIPSPETVSRHTPDSQGQNQDQAQAITPESAVPFSDQLPQVESNLPVEVSATPKLASFESLPDAGQTLDTQDQITKVFEATSRSDE